MTFFPEREMFNLPNIALVIFGTLVAVFLIHVVSKPFEDE